ncbi:MAG TPA: tetratricopeptide repeat protein [Bacteroidia bacterium]|nr:tetratricopeptide repeat protein [Bacteroidia bacterium]HNT80219.1 tetratricopeptide repeat protein [Bacteroidia bacterium]
MKKNIAKSSKKKEQPIKTPSASKSYFIFFFLLGFFLYSNTLNHEYALDDFPVIYGNSLTTQGFDGIPTMLKTAYWYGLDGQNNYFYRPLSLITYAIEWEFSPNNPGLGHWTNSLMYGIICALLFIVLRKMFSSYNLFIPLVATLWFTVHPIHAEVVANIKSRDELLCILLFLANCWMVFSYLSKPVLSKLIGVASLSFLSLMAKESAITFLAIYPLLIFFFTNTSTQLNIKISLTAFLGAAIYLIIRSQILSSQLVADEIKLIDNTLAGADSIWVQWGTAFYIMGMYLKMLIYPYPLSSDYSFSHIELVNFSNLISLVSLIVHVGAFVWAIRKFRSKNPVSFSILFYLITLSLVTNILFLTHSTMADRFLFIPSIGIAILIAFALAKLSKINLKQTMSLNNLLFKSMLAFGILIIISLTYSGMTWSRSADWKNDFSLFSADVLHAPNSSRIHYLYGNHLVQSVKQNLVDKNKMQWYIDTAIVHLKRSVEIHPKNVDAAMVLGDAYGQKRMYKEAVATFEKALLIEPNDGRLLNNMGNTYFRMGDQELALSTFHRALQLNANDADAYNNIGAVYFGQSRIDEAQSMFIKAIELRPDYFDALKNLGSCFGIKQNYDEAIIYLLKALEVSPNDASLLNTVGITYQLKGDQQNAAVYLNRAYALDPSIRR